ncbi:MAG: hypothetical protein WDN28_28945 [Chthoniobacter sp.]
MSHLTGRQTILSIRRDQGDDHHMTGGRQQAPDLGGTPDVFRAVRRGKAQIRA